MKELDGGVTAARGFEAASAAAQIKYSDRTDMALIYSSVPCRAAGTFTSNVVKAAPVVWDMQVVENSPFVQAVVINSGIANAATGKEGMECCEAEAEKTAQVLNIPKSAVLLGSTGVIGMQMPMDKILPGIEMLASERTAGPEVDLAAGRAIMTTDTRPKLAAVSVTIGGRTVTVGGMSKGSGMIHPNMCTMLAFVTSDVNISEKLLKKAVKESVTDTFNMISVDGDTSTNDTLLVLANGLAGNEQITEEDGDYEAFCEALNAVNTSLARQMAGDGEGATALFETRVIHAATKEDARTLAKAVICSSLTKAAIFGHDANWGRILCALGYSGVMFDPENVDLYFSGKSGTILIYSKGKGTDYSEDEATKILSEPEVCVIADMHMGGEEATAWGCDLSYDYVKINADYRT